MRNSTFMAAIAGATLTIAPAYGHPADANRVASLPTGGVRYRWATVDGIRVFYREVGDPRRPTILLLHGFSASSHMFRNLLPLLADRFHLVAPDYPGFGHSDAPPPEVFKATFDDLTTLIDRFTVAAGLTSYILYMQDFGGPVGFRLALRHPERVDGLIVQNANAYRDGLTPAPSQPGHDPGAPTSARVVNAGFIETMYKTGVRDVTALDPDAWTLDETALARPGARRIQAGLIDDYPSNIALYPQWQSYLRRAQPRTLVTWGRNDRGFTPAGAEAFRRDLKDVHIVYLETGHFALEEDAAGIATAIRDWYRPR